jgi:hypothetical protein
MVERLISEAIEPIRDEAAEPAPAAGGNPTPPQRFRWRERDVTVAEVLETWKGLSPRAANVRGQYVRRHWYRVRTADGHVMTIYLVRTAANASRHRPGWWLYSVEEPTAD